jgi:hypothetical protein
MNFNIYCSCPQFSVHGLVSKVIANIDTRRGLIESLEIVVDNLLHT